MKIKVKKVNGFTSSKNGGNPAGVLVNSPYLSDEQMAYITKKLNVSETAFVFPSDKADYKTRFFTPMVEVDLCGHGTIATFYTMAVDGIITKNKTVVTQETNVGVLPVEVIFLDDEVERVMMTQGKTLYKNIHFDISKIAYSLKIDPNEIDNTLPQQIVSTGLFVLPVCIKSFDILKKMKPNFLEVKNICKKIGVGSFHVFTFETIEPDSVYHARNFAPLYGVNEDPTTGTANGAVSSYLVKNKIVKKSSFICEQGDIIGRPGRIFVEIKNNIARVGGKACFDEEKEIEL